tara:strand:+ start:501 stop:887 length:387 start_codon:yes stop_codon:yes gene_type:complete
MRVKINNQIKIKILEDFSKLLYKEVNITLNDFFYYFHSTGLEEEIEQMFSDRSAKEIKEFLFENLLIYKFFTFENYQDDNDKKASKQLIDYIKSDGKIKPKLIKKQNKLGFKTKKKKASIDPNQMKLI